MQLSSSGGIPIENVVVEDYVSSDDSDDLDPGRFSVNSAIKTAFDISKREREELIESRLRMMELAKYMESKGLFMADFEKIR